MTEFDSDIVSKIALVQEPATPPCDCRSLWKVRLLRHDLTGIFEIDVSFIRRDGSQGDLRIPMRNRSDTAFVSKEFAANNARLPNDRAVADKFVHDILAAVPPTAYVLTNRPGFVNQSRGFVMPEESYGSAADHILWDKNAAATGLYARGNASAYCEGVLKLAPLSPYVTLAILIALASPLRTFVESRLRQKLISETAVVHWAGESSCGKTTLARLTQSVFGSPGAHTDYRATERGIAEECYGHNDLVAIFDEAEHVEDTMAHTLKRISALGAVVPSGRSKRTTGKNERFPLLHWNCFAVSTGPQTQASIALRIERERRGQLSRFFDIQLPSREMGGIFMPGPWSGFGTANPAALLAQVESTIGSHHGLLIGPWVSLMLRENWADETFRLVDRFVERVGAPVDPLTLRIARKFGLFYAAGVIGTRSRLLPWKPSWAEAAVEQCYFKAFETRDPSRAAFDLAVLEIAQNIDDPQYFPRFSITKRGVPRLRLNDDAWGYVMTRGSNERIYLIPDHMQRLDWDAMEHVGVEASITRRVASELVDQDRAVMSARGWSRQVRVFVGGTDEVRKMSVWPISRERLQGLVDGIRSPDRRAPAST